MRLLASLLVLLAAIFLHLGGVQADTKDLNNIFPYDNGYVPDVKAYKTLLQDLRHRLASGTDVHGIAVTRPPTSIPPKERFIQVELKNNRVNIISLIIDTKDVYVVGYIVIRTGKTLYVLEDPPAELSEAFPKKQYTYEKLGFSGNYNSLGERKDTPLGHDALNNAIENLFQHTSKPTSKRHALLVIIQMLAEAVRMRYIEDLIVQDMEGANRNFKPDLKAINLENNWSALSKAVQISDESGAFKNKIQIQIAQNDFVTISNVQEAISIAGLALMLYESNPKAIKMPVAVAVVAEMCLQANGANARVFLAKCVIGTEPRQQWALYSDSTIRLYGDRTLCVTSDGHKSLDRIILLKCQGWGNQRWTFMADGTILNRNARLVMDVRNSDVSLQEIILYEPTGNPSQKWLAM